MGLVTYKRSIGSRHPSRILLAAGPGLHCLGWQSVSSSDMSRLLPATSCTGVRRVSLPRSYPHPLYKVRIIESSELLDSFSVQIVLSITLPPSRNFIWASLVGFGHLRSCFSAIHSLFSLKTIGIVAT